MSLIFRKGVAALVLWLGLASGSLADNWLLVQTNVFPAGCASLSTCIDVSTHESRSLMALSPDDTAAFLGIVDQMSEVKDVPALPETSMPADFPLMHIVPRLQVLEVQGKVDALKDLPGVYFDAGRVTGDGMSDQFTSYFTEMLTNAGIPILTEEDALAMPGAARMSVSLSQRRDNAGCILPFRASLSIKEEVVLVRDPSIKLETTTWSASVAENFANTNFTAENALRDAAQKFIDDYLTANAA